MKIYLSILACLLFACSESAEKNSENALSKNKFENILKEIHLTKASFELNKNKKPSNEYHNIYKKYKISADDFQLTLKYYYENPKELEKIYIDILNQLNEEKSKLDQQ